jgi:hypothetical protein
VNEIVKDQIANRPNRDGSRLQYESESQKAHDRPPIRALA